MRDVSRTLAGRRPPEERGSDQGRATRAMKAMLGMKKIDIAALYAAADQA